MTLLLCDKSRLVSFLTLAESPDVKEHQILRVGEFNHKRFGKIIITPKVLETIKANFDRDVRGIQIQTNYEHGLDPTRGLKASGWFSELTVKADGTELWGKIDWTKVAAKEVEDKEWRYLSSELERTWEHPETGKVYEWVLTGAALTNQPFIKGMQPIAASEHQQGDDDVKLTFAEIEAQLKADHGISLSELKEKAGRVDALVSEKTVLLSELATAKDLAKTLGTSNAELTKKLGEAEKAGDEVKFSALVERGMKEGRITKAFADGSLRKIFDAQGLAFAESMVSEMPTNGAINTDNGKGHGGGKEGGGKKYKDVSVELSEKAEARAKADSIDVFSAAKLVLAEDPELDRRYKKRGA